MLRLMILLLALSPALRAESWHEKASHDLAHYGGGTVAAELGSLVDRDWKPWQRCLWEAGLALGVNVAYKTAMNEWSDPQAPERMAVGTLGGFMFYKFNF